MDLLNEEVHFNRNLAETLQQIHDLRQILDTAQEAVLGGKILDAVKLVKEAELRFGQLKGCGNTKLANLMREKLLDLRSIVDTNLTEYWDTLIHMDPLKSAVTIRREIQGMHTYEGTGSI